MQDGKSAETRVRGWSHKQKTASGSEQQQPRRRQRRRPATSSEYREKSGPICSDCPTIHCVNIMAYTLMPRFHLAFRRTLFYFILVTFYLLLGALIFFILWRKGSTVRAAISERQSGDPNKWTAVAAVQIDFERAELLNVLYAEAIGRTACLQQPLAETDWALLANQKFDAYERSLIERVESGHTHTLKQRRISLDFAFRHALSLVTTIGPVDVDVLSSELKIFTIVYAIFGIPLVLAYLGQCSKAIEAALGNWHRTVLTMLGTLVVIAITYDIVEQNSDDTPFADAILSTFLCLTTIGCKDAKDELPSLLLYPAALCALSIFTLTFSGIQRGFERAISSYELRFTQSYAKLERVISGSRLEPLEEVEEEDEDWGHSQEDEEVDTGTGNWT